MCVRWSRYPHQSLFLPDKYYEAYFPRSIVTLTAQTVSLDSFKVQFHKIKMMSGLRTYNKRTCRRYLIQFDYIFPINFKLINRRSKTFTGACFTRTVSQNCCTLSFVPDRLKRFSKIFLFREDVCACPHNC